MKKLRGILLGIALALPLAAIGASGEVTPVGKSSSMTQIQSGPESGRCCWVWHMGTWWCIPC